jgi:hypothetical protein
VIDQRGGILDITSLGVSHWRCYLSPRGQKHAALLLDRGDPFSASQGSGIGKGGQLGKAIDSADEWPGSRTAGGLDCRG